MSTTCSKPAGPAARRGGILRRMIEQRELSIFLVVLFAGDLPELRLAQLSAARPT